LTKKDEAMNPQRYTFDGPPVLPGTSQTPLTPKARASAPVRSPEEVASLIDVLETGVGVFELVSRRIDSGLRIVRKSTGERGYLLRGVTNNIRDLPKLGKVTITTEEVIAVSGEQGLKLYKEWDTDDWQVEEDAQ
jgi:hypothetical protein